MQRDVRELRRDTSPLAALRRLGDAVTGDLMSFDPIAFPAIEDAASKLRDIASDKTSIVKELEDIFERVTSTEAGQHALEKVIELEKSVDVAVDALEGALEQTTSRLHDLQTAVEPFAEAVGDLRTLVDLPPVVPHVSAHEWESRRKFDALVRASQQRRPSPKGRLVKPEPSRPGDLLSLPPSMHMSSNKIKSRINVLRYRLSKARSVPPVTPVTRARMTNELILLKGVLLNRERDEATS